MQFIETKLADALSSYGELPEDLHRDPRNEPTVEMTLAELKALANPSCKPVQRTLVLRKEEPKC